MFVSLNTITIHCFWLTTRLKCPLKNSTTFLYRPSHSGNIEINWGGGIKLRSIQRIKLRSIQRGARICSFPPLRSGDNMFRTPFLSYSHLITNFPEVRSTRIK
jgi:hypothetical protein